MFPLPEPGAGMIRRIPTQDTRSAASPSKNTFHFHNSNKKDDKRYTMSGFVKGTYGYRYNCSTGDGFVVDMSFLFVCPIHYRQGGNTQHVTRPNETKPNQSLHDSCFLFVVGMSSVLGPCVGIGYLAISIPTCPQTNQRD